MGMLLAAVSISVVAAGKTVVDLADEPCPASSPRIGVFYDGRIEMNGTTISTASIGRKLDELTKSGSVVCLHKDHPESDEWLHNYELVGRALLGRKLTISFYWDPAFQKKVIFREQRNAR